MNIVHRKEVNRKETNKKNNIIKSMTNEWKTSEKLMKEIYVEVSNHKIIRLRKGYLGKMTGTEAEQETNFTSLINLILLYKKRDVSEYFTQFFIGRRFYCHYLGKL